MSLDVLKTLFEQHFHAAPTRIQPLQGEFGGSGRKIIRLANDRVTAVGILYGGREENVAFLAFSRHFRRHGLPVPEIYAEDLDHGAYLEEDLGDTTLFEFLCKNRTGENIAPAVVEAYRKVVAILPLFQVEAAGDLDYRVCYPAASFDRQSIAWDLNYFKYYFLRLAGIPFNEHALESDFNRLTDLLLSAPRDYFLYRDFQSRNIMLRDDQPYFVDYQGGRKGALQYDLASLLFDAKADLPPELRDHLLYDYLRALANYIPVDREAFLHHFYAYVYVRIMQALGAYGYRGFFERRAHFLQSVPYALKNIRWLVHNRSIACRAAHAARRVPEHARFGKTQKHFFRSRQFGRPRFQFFLSPRIAQGRNRQRRRFYLRWPWPPESGQGRTLQITHGQGHAGHKLSASTGERASVPCRCV